MSRKGLLILVGILAVALVVLAIAYQNETAGDAQISIGAGDGGISIEIDD